MINNNIECILTNLSSTTSYIILQQSKDNNCPDVGAGDNVLQGEINKNSIENQQKTNLDEMGNVNNDIAEKTITLSQENIPNSDFLTKNNLFRADSTEVIQIKPNPMVNPKIESENTELDLTSFSSEVQSDDKDDKDDLNLMKNLRKSRENILYENCSNANSIDKIQSETKTDFLFEIQNEAKEEILMQNLLKEHASEASFHSDKYMATIRLFMKGAQEPWPKDVKLYQPLEMEQILLPDNANCLAVKAFLKMCNLNFEVEQKPNAEFMSPSGKVPFIKCGAFIVSELEGIIHLVSKKDIVLTSKLNEKQKAEVRVFMSLIRNVLENAELYICWCDPETFNEVTKPRYGCVYPWPLNFIQTWIKKYQVIKHLKVMQWYEKTLQEVYNEVEKCCKSLSLKLQKENSPYFFGDQPCELDALVYGHILSLLKFPLPNPALSSIIKQFPLLIDHCQKIHNHIMGSINDIMMQTYQDFSYMDDNFGDKTFNTMTTMGSELIDIDFDNTLLADYQTNRIRCLSFWTSFYYFNYTPTEESSRKYC